MKVATAIWYVILLVYQLNAEDSQSEENVVEDSEITTFRKLFIQKRIIQLGAIKQLFIGIQYK